jgi:hypothetical protein
MKNIFFVKKNYFSCVSLGTRLLFLKYCDIRMYSASTPGTRCLAAPFAELVPVQEGRNWGFAMISGSVAGAFCVALVVSVTITLIFKLVLDIVTK